MVNINGRRASEKKRMRHRLIESHRSGILNTGRRSEEHALRKIFQMN
ncbi:hypothetical protein X727_07620 [Mesorhizobium sp. L103C119B0]|nr:hypothetical protein X727_07620 [Mesorhizobium sp. L103C119B0]